MAKKIEKSEENLMAVESALGKTEQFIETHKNLLAYILIGIVALVLIYMGVRRFYFQPREIEAQAQIFVAEQYFEKDSLDLAMFGDGTYPGFEEIIDNYGGTKSGNLAKYYLGICYLNKGEFETAIKYLKKFKSKDKIVGPMAKGAIGDAYLELGKNEEALEYYMKAANMNKNILSTPVFLMKAGLTYEILENKTEAVKIYKIIKQEYPKSFEAREIDKYIARASAI